MTISVCLSTLFAFSACEDNNTINEEYTNDSFMFLKTNEIEANSSTRYFTDYDQIAQELEKIISLDIEDLIAYEDSIGVISFGRASEELYYSIINNLESTSRIPDSVTMFNIIYGYVNQYTNYLELIQKDGEYHFNPKLGNNPWRYVVGVNQICQIGDSVLYKIFDKGIVYSSIENLTNLVNLREQDLENIETSTFFTYYPCFHVNYNNIEAGNLGWTVYAENFSTNRKDKLEVTADMAMVFCYQTTSPYYGKYLFSGGVLFKPKHKTLGIYFISKRTIITDIKVNYYIANAGYLTKKDKYTTPSPVWKRTIGLEQSGKYYNSSIAYFTSTSGTVKISTVTVNFNN
ncbi:MAG: hypothetical protein LBP67_01140 [Bacteroidales bacterium]|jgi:hypothetical protein|nr:hypothetical protein [Bacteroidales bacterium]